MFQCFYKNNFPARDRFRPRFAVYISEVPIPCRASFGLWRVNSDDAHIPDFFIIGDRQEVNVSGLSCDKLSSEGLTPPIPVLRNFYLPESIVPFLVFGLHQL